MQSGIASPPPGLSLESEGGNSILVRRWFSKKSWYLLVFAALWNAALGPWWRQVLSLEERPQTSEEWLAVLFPSLHAGIGFALIYVALCSLWNRTRIAASPVGLAVHTGPLPWPGNKIVPRPLIAELELERKEVRGRNRFTRFGVAALLRDGRKVSVVSTGESECQAKFLEGFLRSRLGL